MPSFDIKSEIDKHELTNVVDQANRVLKNRFDFKDADAEFKLNDNSILLTAKEDFHIKQMSSVLHESITKRKMDIRILKPGKQAGREMTKVNMLSPTYARLLNG